MAGCLELALNCEHKVTKQRPYLHLPKAFTYFPSIHLLHKDCTNSRSLATYAIGDPEERQVDPNQEDDDTLTIYEDLSDTDCAPLYHLVSVKTASSSAKKFVKRTENETDVFPVKSQQPIVMTFDLDPIEDVGGLFIVEVNASTLPNPLVSFCLQKMGPAIKDNVKFHCDKDRLIQSDLSSRKRERWIMPFPVVGTLYLTLQMECFNDSNPTECGEEAEIIVNLSLDQQCIGGCGKNGLCSVRYRAGIQFFYCRCYYGYTGFACTDSSEAWARSYYLVQVLLLTLSNVVFLVATIFAIYRYHFAESVSYFATTVFSTLYHACDSSRACVMDYSTLQFCDFYSSFMSVFLTLIAMAKLNPTLKSTVHMIGAFFCAFAAQYDRFSLWAILVPVLSGLAVMSVSWGHKMYQHKQLYPSKKRWILFIIPGIILALIGLIFTSALETDANYFIMHSIWHICMGLSALFPSPAETHATEEAGLGKGAVGR
ncbi:putative transmembrane protein [Apostichopus japonicus]|uniref:Putative transmembrane protein n=1 Tax=Stichopus japonicus TaxID=307972 RepID=A0A2G8KH26_STIJA|nr:putative transmembrane protein [Apostichopus japonicus]